MLDHPGNSQLHRNSKFISIIHFTVNKENFLLRDHNDSFVRQGKWDNGGKGGEHQENQENSSNIYAQSNIVCPLRDITILMNS